MSIMFFSGLAFLGGLLVLMVLAILVLLLFFLFCELWELIFGDPRFAFQLPSWPKKPARPLVRGDVVKLKSGGPDMMVEQYTTYYGWLCRWMNGNKVESAHFQPETLKRVKA